jgi:hypothetical protein
VSTLEMLSPNDDQLLEMLHGALVAGESSPNDAGLAALQAAFDANFYPGRRKARLLAGSGRKRRVPILGAVAASVVALTFVLSWQSLHRQRPALSALDRVQSATVALQEDVMADSPSSRIAHDVVALAQSVDRVPVTERTRTEAARGTILRACSVLKAASTGTPPAPVAAALASACRTRTTRAAPEASRTTSATSQAPPRLRTLSAEVPQLSGRRHGFPSGGRVVRTGTPPTGMTGPLRRPAISSSSRYGEVSTPTPSSTHPPRPAPAESTSTRSTPPGPSEGTSPTWNSELWTRGPASAGVDYPWDGPASPHAVETAGNRCRNPQ